MAQIPDPQTTRLHFERLLESLPDLVYFKDREGRFLCINEALAHHFGLTSPAEAIGKTDYDFFETALAHQKDTDEREIVRTGHGLVGKEERSPSADGGQRWVLTSKLPLFGPDGGIVGTFGMSRDISEMKEAHESLQEQHRLLSTLIEILPCRIFVKDREGRLRLTNRAYRDAVGARSAEEIHGRTLSELTGNDRSGAYAADDRAVIEQGLQILNREDYDASPLGNKRWLLLSKVPLRDGDGLVQGLVGMAADISAQKQAEARAIAAQRALEEKNRQIESELNLARELQTELMAASVQSVSEAIDPGAPFCPKIGFHYEASEHLAGDFFQLIPISPRRFALLLCDVMGHGVKAALVTTLIRGLLADLSNEDVRPSSVLSRLNERLCVLLDRPPIPRFVTAGFATFDLDQGSVQLASAGHWWPLYGSAEKPTQPVAAPECGPALGLIRQAVFPSYEQKLARGDSLTFFTDGWTEETNAAGEEFGRPRLCAELDARQAEDPRHALAAIAAQVRKFSGKPNFTDDLCAIVARF